MNTWDTQKFIEWKLQARRDEAMKTSAQLTLGELIAKLEAIENKDKPVIFNEQYHPISIDSWRGSYAELALEYAESGDKLTTSKFLEELSRTVGLTLMGYKGGEYLMGKTTPVWVANYGESYGFADDSQAVVGVSQNEQSVIIETRNIEY